MAVVFKAGDLRHRMTFQSRSSGKDALGGQVLTWADAFTIWVDIQELSGHELFTAQAAQSEVTHTISARYRAEFADKKAIAAMRGTYAGRIFNLHAVLNVEERNKYVQVMASEGLNDG